MEVHAGGFIAEIVFKIDGDSIADISIKRWWRPLAIDCNDGPRLQTIRILSLPAKIPVIGRSGNVENVVQDNEKVGVVEHLG